VTSGEKGHKICLRGSAGHFLWCPLKARPAELRRFPAIPAVMQPDFSATQTGWRREWDPQKILRTPRKHWLKHCLSKTSYWPCFEFPSQTAFPRSAWPPSMVGRAESGRTREAERNFFHRASCPRNTRACALGSPASVTRRTTPLILFCFTPTLEFR